MKPYHTSSSSRKRLEQRRMRAGKLFRKGLTQAEIARILRVTPAAVNQWYVVWKKRGMSGLKSKGHPGVETALTKEKAEKLKRAILKGPRSFGYTTNLWTLERIKAVAKKEAGLSFGITRVWHMVIALGFSCQKPVKRAVERDEKAITAWRLTTFPRLKKMG
ncbi:MAG: winged helix-turn-helix domain-containing protein [Patescibacteria group bacterium]